MNIRALTRKLDGTDKLLRETILAQIQNHEGRLDTLEAICKERGKRCERIMNLLEQKHK